MSSDTLVTLKKFTIPHVPLFMKPWGGRKNSNMPNPRSTWIERCLIPGTVDKMLGACPTPTYWSIMRRIFKGKPASHTYQYRPFI